MKIVPKVLGINQCSFTVVSPDSHSWESSISQHLGKSSHLYRPNSSFALVSRHS